MKVLICEDDAYTREALTEILETEGYEVIVAANGAEGLKKFHEEKPQFVCLDIMMPEKNGYEVCKEIRKQNGKIPILFLSAKSEEIDKVIGLELGADDYIVKPFGIKEVIARIRAITRRALQENPQKNNSFKMHHLEIFPDKLSVKNGENSIDLCLRDLQILQFFKQNSGIVQTRSQLFKACWGMNYSENTRALDQKIPQLRKLIEPDPQNPTIIKTVHGMGYIYEDHSQ